MDTGVVVSSVGHIALLVFALVSFSSTPKFDDAQESVPVDMVTNQQFNDIMKGEKTAKEVHKSPKAQKLADIAKVKPDTQTPEVQRDIVVPMPPMRRQPDPGKDATQEPPVPADKPPPPAKPVVAKVAPTPPTPPAPKPPAPTPPLPPEPKDAEVIKPAPPKKPPPKKPEPPKEVAKIEPPKVPLPPKEVPKVKQPETKLADLGKFLADQKQKDAAKTPKKPPAKPMSGAAAHRTDAKSNLADIANFLNHDKPQQTASTGARLSQTASLGAKNASAARMSPSLSGQLGALIIDHFHECWNTDGLPSSEGYMAQIEVHFRPDGTFSAPPRLLNPASSGQSRSIGESALSAVQSCPPLKIPQRFQPYYSEWKDQFLRLKPEST
ncbi:MAG: cell envelope biogenesis protein TolA [Hyphomicrobiales bacterium]|nr:cell envelope biogenesis protein TolA [Hyphomicrobiales bacterium]MDE2115864.1 cell envelope biogenesis protein TolA [Hyphomicrobiales bacterium]